MRFLDKAVVAMGAAFAKAGDVFDKVFLGEDGMRSERAAAEFEIMNFFANEHGLKIHVEEKGQGLLGKPDTTLTALIVIANKKAGFHGDRKIAIDIDMTSEATTECGMRALKKAFFNHVAAIKPDALRYMHADVAPR